MSWIRSDYKLIFVYCWNVNHSTNATHLNLLMGLAKSTSNGDESLESIRYLVVYVKTKVDFNLTSLGKKGIQNYERLIFAN